MKLGTVTELAYTYTNNDIIVKRNDLIFKCIFIMDKLNND